MTTSIGLLFVCLALAFADQVKLSGAVGPGFYSYQTVRITNNWQDTITVTATTHKQDIQVCIVESPSEAFKIPNNTLYWNVTCKHYLTFKEAVPTPTPTPEPTPTHTPEPTPTHTETPTPAPETPTPTETPTPAPVTPTPTPVDTPTPTPTPVDTPTPTPVVTPTPTDTPVVTPTPTDTPVVTPTPTDTPVATPTPTTIKRVIFQEGPQTVVVRNVQYYAAVALLHSDGTTETVEVDIEGDTCPGGQVTNGTGCVAVIPLEKGDTKVNFTKDATQVFSFALAQDLIGNLNFNSSDHAALTFTVRYQGAPSKDQNDGSGPSVDVGAPRSGAWFVAVTPSADVTDAILTVDLNDCSMHNDSFGSNCEQKYEAESYKMDLQPNKNYYFKTVVNATTPLWVSVRTDSGADFPVMWATQGQQPTAVNAQITNCNFDYCDGAFIIYVNVSATEDVTEGEQTWFISTFTGVPNNTYGIWFNSVCPQPCTDENTGTCQEQAPDYGMCKCATSSLIGVACTTRVGLGPEYIVLIIIAALVVASAIIGFVAWAYMRRKRVQYEHVS